MHFSQTVVAFLLLVLTTSKRRKGKEYKPRAAPGVWGAWGDHQQYLLHLRPYVQLWKPQEQSGSGKNNSQLGLGFTPGHLLSCQEMREKCKHIRMKLGAIYFFKK